MDNQQFLTNMLLTQTANLKRMSNCITVFTKKGFDNFVQNGIIQQIPSQLYHPLSIKNRILILNRMLQANQSGAFCFHLIKEESFHPKIEIFTYDTDSMLLSYQNVETSMMQTSLIKEPNTILAFNDFIQNLSNHNLVYDIDETSDILHQQIQSLKQALPPPPRTYVLDFCRGKIIRRKALIIQKLSIPSPHKKGLFPLFGNKPFLILYYYILIQIFHKSITYYLT